MEFDDKEFKDEIKELSKKPTNEILAEILLNLRTLNNAYFDIHENQLFPEDKESENNQKWEEFSKKYPKEAEKFGKDKFLQWCGYGWDVEKMIRIAQQRQKAEELRNQTNEKNKSESISKILAYVKNNTDWMLKSKPARIQFFYSNTNYAFDFTNAVGTTTKQKLTKIEIENLIEPYYKNK